MLDINEFTKLTNTAVELKRGGLYVVQCDEILTGRQRKELAEWCAYIDEIFHVKFIVLNSTLKLVTRPQEFEKAEL